MLAFGFLMCKGNILFDFFQFWSSLRLWNVLVVIAEESCTFYNFSQASNLPTPTPTPYPAPLLLDFYFSI